MISQVLEQDGPANKRGWNEARVDRATGGKLTVADRLLAAANKARAAGGKLTVAAVVGNVHDCLVSRRKIFNTNHLPKPSC